MNKSFKIALFAAVAAISAPSFGMEQALSLAKKHSPKKHSKQNSDSSSLVSNDPLADVFSTDFLVSIAAFGDGEVKNNMRVNKKLYGIIRKTNPSFVMLPTFDAPEKDIIDIMTSFAWNGQHPQVVSSVRKKITSPDNLAQAILLNPKIGHWGFDGYDCKWPHQFTPDYVGNLKADYVEKDTPVVFYGKKLPSQAEQALLFALLCKDEKSVAIIAPKIKTAYGDFPHYVKLELHHILYRYFVHNDKADALNLFKKYDPYGLSSVDPMDNSQVKKDTKERCVIS